MAGISLRPASCKDRKQRGGAHAALPPVSVGHRKVTLVEPSAAEAARAPWLARPERVASPVAEARTCSSHGCRSCAHSQDQACPFLKLADLTGAICEHSREHSRLLDGSIGSSQHSSGGGCQASHAGAGELFPASGTSHHMRRRSVAGSTTACSTGGAYSPSHGDAAAQRGAKDVCSPRPRACYHLPTVGLPSRQQHTSCERAQHSGRAGPTAEAVEPSARSIEVVDTTLRSQMGVSTSRRFAGCDASDASAAGAAAQRKPETHADAAAPPSAETAPEQRWARLRGVVLKGEVPAVADVDLDAAALEVATDYPDVCSSAPRVPFLLQRV